MKKLLVIFFSAILCFLVASKTAAQNSLSGIVFDESRKPVGKIDVELLDEFERLLKTTKTSPSGLYIFQALRAGIYFVQIRTDGTNYKSVKERVQLGQTNRTSITGQTSGGEALQINFTLETDRRGNQTSFSNEVIFAQNVPPE